MNKEEALNDFLKGLRIVLNNASAYSKDHPYFRKSVEVFKEKADALTPFLNPIKINFAPESIFIDGNKLEKSMLYVDLAAMFHRRKIKSVEIRSGFTIEELIEFLSSVSMPIKEILKQGGIQSILDKVKSRHILAEELDYSAFLEEEGEESKDIWAYLFKEAVRKENPAQINEFADNFGSIIKKFKAKDLFEDDELRQDLHNFLEYLKNKEKNKFNNCSKELLKHILKDKNISIDAELGKMKVFFEDLDKDSLAEALWDQISNNDAFNYTSFQLFSQLVSQDTHKDIASSLGEKIRNTESLKNNPAIRKKIKELFSGIDKSSIIEFYRHEVYSPFKDAALEESLSFDRDFLPVNYFLVLLNLFTFEDSKEKLDLISKRLICECDRLICRKSAQYLKYLWEVLDKKRKENPSLVGSFEEFQKRIFSFIENESFEEEPVEGIEYFIGKLDTSVLGADFYLDKIFNKRKVNSYALNLFLKFFPQDLARFLENIKSRHAQIDLIARVVKSIEGADSPQGLEILKNIFSVSGNIIKIEVLKSMQALPVIDDEFLFSVLGKGDIFLKREALAILAKDDNLKKKALEKLFFIKSPFGKRNQLIIENLIAIEDTEIEGAQDYIIPLSKRSFFWNRDMREKALEVLRKWNVGKN